MDYLEFVLRRTLIKYKKAWSELEKRESTLSRTSIKGRLVISKSHDRYQFYWITLNDKNNTGKQEIVKRYLGSDENETVRTLAQKSYDMAARRLLSKRIPQLEGLLKDYQSGELDLLYDILHPMRKRSVQPLLPTNRQRMDQWKRRAFQPKSISNMRENLYTNKNEKVRSKSEKILADLFTARGIEYKYECPLYLPNGTCIHPDFTFYHPERQIEMYWEHFGMMDVPEYANNALRRIALYESANIHPGDRLIMTFESSECTLDLRIAEERIQRYLWKDHQ